MADETIEKARRELAVLGQIVDIMEPLEHDKRVRVLAATLCLQDTDLSHALIALWERRGR